LSDEMVSNTLRHHRVTSAARVARSGNRNPRKLDIRSGHKIALHVHHEESYFARTRRHYLDGILSDDLDSTAILGTRWRRDGRHINFR
jgi:hypothetical protein